MLERTARLGTLTGAGEPLFRIAEDGQIELEADVVEQDLAAMRIGDPATISADGFPDRAGQVRLISPVIDPVTRLGGVRIAIQPAAGDAVLRTGAFARAVVIVDRREALTVPASAVLSVDGIDSVRLVLEGRVETRDVVTGTISDGRRGILSGLVEGDAVVARAGAFLRDGDRVTAVADPAIPSDTATPDSVEASR